MGLEKEACELERQPVVEGVGRGKPIQFIRARLG